MKLPRRQFLHLAASAAALPAVSRIAWAQAWPAKPIRAIVAGGAGSVVDVVPRVVFENRTGAGGTIAVAAVAKADPDGYTILAQSSALAVAPWFHPNLSYDTVRDISGIAPIGSVPNVLVTSPLKGAKTIQAFVAAAKAMPGSFNYTSTGVGTATHMSAERFRVSAGIEAVHVPVKSGPEALTEILSGRADFYFCPIGTALPFIREGKLSGLVVSGERRAPELPEVPTTSEAGFANADYILWLGLFAPVRTPRSLVDRLHGETVKAMQAASVQEKLAILGVTPMSMTPEQFDAHIKDEIAPNGLLVKAAGIKPE